MIILGNCSRRYLGVVVLLNIRHGRDVAVIKVVRIRFEKMVMNLAMNVCGTMDGGSGLEVSNRIKRVEDTPGISLKPMPT